MRSIPWLALGAVCCTASAHPLWVAFDFSRHAIGLQATVHHQAVYVILDTGVDPSVIDVRAAKAAALKVDRSDAGEMSGVGNAAHASAYSGRIDGLEIGARAFAPFDTLVTGMAGLSQAYGRKLDGVLGYSFLHDKIVLIDYPRHMLGILDRQSDAAPNTSRCGNVWSTPMRTWQNFPVIQGFRFGTAHGPVTLDTGSNGTLSLYQEALRLPDVRTALSKNGSITFSGVRGSGQASTYAFRAPLGFGPFAAPANVPVNVRDDKGSPQRLGNAGNSLFDAMKLKILLDYRHRMITYYGQCD